MRLFKEFGWNFTTYAVAVALKKNPTFSKALVRDGRTFGTLISRKIRNT
jgi:hypothetical protein